MREGGQKEVLARDYQISEKEERGLQGPSSRKSEAYLETLLQTIFLIFPEESDEKKNKATNHPNKYRAVNKYLAHHTSHCLWNKKKKRKRKKKKTRGVSSRR